MKLYISHQSALSFWQSAYAEHRKPSGSCLILPSESLSGIRIDPEDFTRKGISADPLHLTVGTPGHRCKRRGIACHVYGAPLPAGAFEKLAEDRWIASPEMVFCQLAGELPFGEQVKLGYDLTAGFRINDFTDDVERIEPLTGPAALRRFSSQYSGPGAKAARMAARYVCGNTASPMEIALAMLLTLPRMHGGYGLPLAEPNREIRIGPRRGARTEQRYRGDLVWLKQRIIVEYDSELHHRAPQKISDDAIRRNNLQDAGWRVVTVTWEQVRTSRGLDTVAEQLARALGVHNGYLSAEGPARRIRLRKLLLPWAFPGFEGF